MELYHQELKLRLLNEKDPTVYQRADWLVDKLGTKVHSYFWLDEYSGKDDFARYRKDKCSSGLTSWRKALTIPDSLVIIESLCAKVTDHLNQGLVYVVWNPGSQFSLCNCSWAEMGYLCEHMFKVLKCCREKGSSAPSVSLNQYKKALVDMLRCPPHDSLVRDHSLSLATYVQKLLNELSDPVNKQKENCRLLEVTKLGTTNRNCSYQNASSCDQDDGSDCYVSPNANANANATNLVTEIAEPGIANGIHDGMAGGSCMRLYSVVDCSVSDAQLSELVSNGVILASGADPNTDELGKEKKTSTGNQNCQDTMAVKLPPAKMPCTVVSSQHFAGTTHIGSFTGDSEQRDASNQQNAVTCESHMIDVEMADDSPDI